ncbi:hypothetical protein P3342_010724 [Pyrenophora teres f. teres]|nr:hypothetical protein P3342_010724 [Pyrenophora teres f. teres]
MPEKSTTDFVEDTAPAGQKSKAQILTDVYSLASQFSTCVEAFNLIHPSKDHDHAQKVALAKLGLQQGRLLIFGDAVGISAPPATIARHMIPSHPGITNPDPHLPVNFGVRDPRLDEEVTNAKIRRALHEIAGRPANTSRDELMNLYGLKSPKSFTRIEYPALDTNRLEGFREKYALLKDLLNQTGARSSLKRNPSMTTSHWTVKDTTRFAQYVKVVRTEVDALIDLMGVKSRSIVGFDQTLGVWAGILISQVQQYDRIGRNCASSAKHVKSTTQSTSKLSTKHCSTLARNSKKTALPGTEQTWVFPKLTPARQERAANPTMTYAPPLHQNQRQLLDQQNLSRKVIFN